VTINGIRHAFAMRPVRSKLTAAGTQTITLRLPAAVEKSLRRSLKGGQRGQVLITVLATDQQGHGVSAKRILALRP
jgi:hypothetical protein